MSRRTTALSRAIESVLATSTRGERRTCAQGNVQTRHPRVRAFWSEEALDRDPIVLDAGLVVVASGRKIGYFADREVVYDPEQYLVVSAPVPFECSTIASPREPLVGLFIQADLVELHELVVATNLEGCEAPDDAGIAGARLAPTMLDAVTRLARTLQSERDTAVLGGAVVREVMYRALLGEHGASLSQLTQHDTEYASIARVLATVRSDLTRTRSVAELASLAGMSPSTFHRAFRRATDSSPIQYLKKLRLQKAFSLIRHEGIRAKDAAARVGYENPSQFSREFSRYFRTTATAVRKAYLADHPS